MGGRGVHLGGRGREGRSRSRRACRNARACRCAVAPKTPDIETALGTRWAVWVGGLALALGGLFLIRYSIEAGIFGPGVRLTMAGLLGLVLVGGGEFIRRTGFKVPVEGAAGAYVPGILTAAGAFTLFGTVYAAHGIYGFIGPAFAFLLLGVIGVGTIAAALVHGQALAGVGLLGSMVTPVLVSSQSPNAWALFGYLAIVLVANTAIARLRDWTFLAAAGFVGAGLWTLVYLSEAPVAGFHGADVHQPGDARLARLRLAQGGARAKRTAFRLAVHRARLLRRADGGAAAGRSRISGDRRRRSTARC